MTIEISSNGRRLEIQKRTILVKGDFVGSAGTTDATRYFLLDEKDASVLDVCLRVHNFQTGTASAATLARMSVIAAVTHPFNRSTNPEIVALTAQIVSNNSVALPATDERRMIPTALNELLSTTTTERSASDFYGITRTTDGTGTVSLTAQNLDTVPFPSPNLPLAKTFSRVQVGLDITGGTSAVTTYVDAELDVILAVYAEELPPLTRSAATAGVTFGSSVTRDAANGGWAATGTAGQAFVGNAGGYTPA